MEVKREGGAAPGVVRRPQVREGMLLFYAAVMVAFIPLDVALGASFAEVTLVRLCWAFATATPVLLLRFRPDALTPFAQRGLPTLSAASIVALVEANGGAGSPYTLLLVVLPPLYALLLPDRRFAVVVHAVGCCVGGIALFASSGQPAGWIVVWSAVAVTTAAISIHGVGVYERLLAAELTALRARARAERQLAQSEKQRVEVERLAQLGRLAAGVAHEINNPLAFLTGNVEWLARQDATGKLASNPGALREVIDESRSGLKRIAQIVADLRGFSRQGPDELAECDVSLVVAEAVRLASVKLETAQVEQALPDSLPLVSGSRQRLVQVLVNLLANGVDALEAKAGGRITVRATADVDAVSILVEDDGPGLSREVQERLFEPFFTTKPPGKGTGLGLALSREYLLRGGGSLEATNRPEGGARFIVRVPVHRAVTRPPQTPVPQRAW